MAIQVISGASANQLTVDPASKAMRASIYTADGIPMAPSDQYRGIAAIAVRQSAATTVPQAVWAIYNSSSTNTVHIKEIYMQLFFDGTGAATNMKYEWIKATGVTAFSGGVVVTPLNKKLSISDPTASIRVLDTGLTTTGATFGGQMCIVTQGRAPSGGTQGISFQSTIVSFGFEMFREFPIELAKNEVFALRLFATAVIGDNVAGYVEFSETLN